MIALILPVTRLSVGQPVAASLSSAGPARGALGTLRAGGIPAGILNPMQVLVSEPRLVTSAALILTLRVRVHGHAPLTFLKVLATGLAAGILVDAFVVRCLLVPALVSLFGRWNWFLPATLGRLLRARAPAT